MIDHTLVRNLQISVMQSRYAAAWQEQGVRIAQRQGVMNIYVTFSPAIFGVFLGIESRRNENQPTSHIMDTDSLAAILLLSIAAFSLACSAMVWAHHRVMRQLQRFLLLCESFAANEIRGMANGRDDLFYFLRPTGESLTPARLDSFHTWQKCIQGIIFAGIFLTSGLAALFITWGNPIPLQRSFAIAATIVSLLLPVEDVIRPLLERVRKIAAGVGRAVRP